MTTTTVTSGRHHAAPALHHTDEPVDTAEETPNPNRHKDFVAFVMADVRRRAREEAEQANDGSSGELGARN